MNGVVSCREFGLVPVGGHSGLVDRELEHLVKLRETGPFFFSEERRGGVWHCRFAGFAGAIVMPGGRTLEILPKIAGEAEAPARGLIMRMLAATRLAPAIERDLDAYASSPHLIEAYLRLAADLALQQLRRGLVHAYRRLDLRLPVVRGRLRIAAQLARLPERLDAHLLSADVFTADTDLNRAIKGGIGRIERLSRVTDTRARCRELLTRLGAVANAPRESQRLAALLRGLVLDRRHAHFASLIRVLKLIVTDQGSAAAAGADAPGPAWLFAMDELFEAYVAERLHQVARGVEIAIQGPIRPFAVDGSFPLRPDVVVIAAGQPVLVLDTKWKLLDRGLNDADPGDLRQAYAYARVYGVDRAVLAYPGTSAAQCLRREFVVNDGSAIRISVCQLPLFEDDAGELDRALGDLIAHN